MDGTRDMRTAMCAVLPGLTFISVQVIGRLNAAELLLALLLPLLLFTTSSLPNQRVLGMLGGLAALWIVSVVATDVIREVELDVLLRGWANVLFTITTFVALYLLTEGRTRRIQWVCLSWALGQIIVAILNRQLLGDSQWKLGLGEGVVVAGLTVLSLLHGHEVANARRARVWLIFVACISVVESARNLMARCLIVALAGRRSRVGGHRIGRRGLVLPLLGLMLAAVTAAESYRLLAEAGYVGEEASKKFQYQQVEGLGPLGMLLGGRSELLVSTKAIADSPFLGHGSWARSWAYFVEHQTIRRELFGPERLMDVKQAYEWYGGEPLIPTHSILFGQWVYHGLGAALFWIYVLSICAQALLRTSDVPMNIRFLYTHLLVLFLWSLLFSPLNGERRVEVAVLMCVALDVMRLQQSARRGSGCEISRPKDVAHASA